MTGPSPSPVVFLGPTMPVEQALEILPARYVGPAGCGDILACLRLDPSVILLVDGLFERRPAVWHKEILFALEAGVPVVGAASMGALRAAELHTMGMIGVGEVFRRYRDGVLVDDDEVAVAHAERSDGYRSLSTAMVDIRFVLDRAVTELGLDVELAEAVAREAKRLFYPDRSVTAAVRRVRSVLDDPGLDRLLELESTGQPSLKRQDAAEALTMIADAHVPAPSFPADHEPVRRSVFFRKRCLEVACEPLPFTGSWLPAREARIQRAAGAPLDRTLLTELARGLAAVEAIARARNLAATEPWTALTGDDDFQLGSEPGTESWCEGRDLSQTEARMAAARLAAIHELVSIAGATAGWPTHLHGLLRIHGAHASLPASLRTSDPSKLETVADARFRTFRHLAKLWAVIDRAAVDRGLDGRRLPDTALIAEFREARELLRPQDLAEWLEVNEIDEDGLRELIRSEARIRFVTDNLQLLGTADQALDVAWVSDALLIVESGPAKATPRPPGPPRTLWTAEEGLRLAYELIHEEFLPEHPDLFSRMASRSPTETDPIAAGVRALLLDLNEHLFCAATDARRRVAIERHATGRVLDHGCGAGFHTVELAERGHPVSAVDTDEVKLRYLRHVAGRRGLTDRIDFVWCGGYDTVLSINVLDHLADASDLVSELAASLVPGGRLLLYAHFTDDGSHTSDDEIVSRVFSALTADLDRPVPQPGAELEVWIRRQPGPTSERPLLAPSAADVNRLDRLHPHAHPELVSGRRRGTTVVGGDRFYLRPTELSPTATELLGHCDGRLSVAQIAVAMASSGTSLETVREISLQLWSRHLIWMQRPVPE